MTSRGMRRANARMAAKQMRRATAAAGVVAMGAGAPLGAAVVFAPPAEAASFSVTTNADSGAGSLRDAITQANATPGPDEITFAPSVTGTITLTTGELGITDDITVTGPGSGVLTVNAGGESRVFNATLGEECVPDGTYTEYYGYSYPNYVCETVGPTSAVVISGLSLTDAAAPEQSYSYYGYIYEYHENGGAVAAVTNLYDGDDTFDVELDDLTVTGGLAGRGAAVYVSGTDHLGVSDSEFDGNTVDRSAGGAVYARSVGDVAISGTKITDNTAIGSGGGVYISTFGSDIAISDTIISGNEATNGSGGGLFVYGLYGQHELTNSQITGNAASIQGGGAWFYGAYADRVVSGSTISDNDLTTTYSGYYGNYGLGGGLLVGGDDASAVITHSTIAGNTALGAGGIITGRGATSLRNTIVADNGTEDVKRFSSSLPATTLEYSLVEHPVAFSTVNATGAAGTNKTGVDPELGALANNGGTQLTQRPAVTSPAVDAGKAYGATVDATGSPRTVDLASVANATGGDATDMGAVEVPANAVSPVVNNALPAVAGTAKVGNTLTTTGGTWTPATVTRTYQWLRNGSPIAGATAASYAPGASDVGTKLSVAVTASKPGYDSVTKTSAQTPAVAAGTITSAKPTLKGKPIVGKSLKAKLATTTPANATVTYQWLRKKQPIAGATKKKYKLTAADAGQKIRVVVTYKAPGYANLVLKSKKIKVTV